MLIASIPLQLSAHYTNSFNDVQHSTPNTHGAHQRRLHIIMIILVHLKKLPAQKSGAFFSGSFFHMENVLGIGAD